MKLKLKLNFIVVTVSARYHIMTSLQSIKSLFPQGGVSNNHEIRGVAPIKTTNISGAAMMDQSKNTLKDYCVARHGRTFYIIWTTPTNSNGRVIYSATGYRDEKIGADIRKIKMKQGAELLKPLQDFDLNTMRNLFDFETELLSKLKEKKAFEKACFFTLMRNGAKLDIIYFHEYQEYIKFLSNLVESPDKKFQLQANEHENDFAFRRRIKAQTDVDMKQWLSTVKAFPYFIRVYWQKDWLRNVYMERLALALIPKDCDLENENDSKEDDILLFCIKTSSKHEKKALVNMGLVYEIRHEWFQLNPSQLHTYISPQFIVSGKVPKSVVLDNIWTERAGPGVYINLELNQNGVNNVLQCIRDCLYLCTNLNLQVECFCKNVFEIMFCILCCFFCFVLFFCCFAFYVVCFFIFAGSTTT